MNEEWPLVRLAEVTRQVQDVESVRPGAEYPLLGVRWYADGPFVRETVTSETSKASRLYRVSPGQFIYNRMFAWKGAFGVVPAELDGCFVSNEFPLFECDERSLLAEYLGLWFRQSSVWDAVGSASTGTTASRNRWKESQFREYVIPLPTVDEQRRIVDLMAHLDNHLENLKAEIEAGAQLEGRFLERLLGSAESVRMLALGDVGEFIRGRRFTKADYVRSGLGCIHYGQVHTHFGPIATEVLTYVPVEMQSRLRLARAGDVVIAATSEDLSGLGKATAWLGASDVAVHDDCYIFRHSLDPKYASYALASPWFQSQKAQFGDGMKVTRISSSDLAKIQIPVPPRETQIRVGEAMASITSKSEAMRAEVASLTSLRQCLLSLLLSGQVQIPTGFDEFLSEVA